MTKMMRLGWAMSLGLLVTASGCEVGTCDRPDGGSCFDDDLFDWDSGMDATAPDAGGPADAGPQSDASVETDAGIDASVAPGPIMNVERFCEAQASRARAWRDYFEECCFNQALTEREDFLLESLSYAVEPDGVERCIGQLKPLVESGKIVFNAQSAEACVASYTSQYVAPPSSCPASGGIDIAQASATVGHGAAFLWQLPTCRAALAGTVAFGGACNNSLECANGRRCLGDVGAKTCRDPRGVSNSCGNSGDCADDLICVGDAMRRCVPRDQPLDVTESCGFSPECRGGLVCSAQNECVNPVPTFICTL